MERQVLSPSLEENKAFFQGCFENAMDFIVREVDLSGRRAALFAVGAARKKNGRSLS